MSNLVKVSALKLDARLKADVLLVPVLTPKGRAQVPALAGLSAPLKAKLRELGGVYHGSSEIGALESQSLAGKGGVQRLVLVGVGAGKAARPKDVRLAAGIAMKWCEKHRCRRVAVASRALSVAGGDEALAAWVEGCVLGCYRYDLMKSKPSKGGVSIRNVQLVAGALSAGLAKICRRASIVADAANETRTLGHEPPNIINPVTLAARLEKLAPQWDLKCTVLDEKKMTALGMGAMLAVGKGSETKPRLITLEHAGVDPEAPPVVLVGKAVTMDTGGISIKPAESIPAMKYDKQGGMTVIGVLKAVAALKLPQRVIGVIGAAENMISSHSYRPGDILTAMNGKTIEVLNTDAEGRLVLADALHYAEKHYEPAVMLDLATLTGSVMVALGEHAAGLFSSDDELAQALINSGERTSERLWRLPLWPEYRRQLMGGDADIKNMGGRKAGAITAAMFLKEFVTDKTPWAHLDIAGTAFTDRVSPLWPAGATGFGVRMLVDFIEHQVG